MNRLWSSVLVAFLALPILEAAEQTPTNAPPTSRKSGFLKRFDKNGDGKLDRAEQEVARKAHQAEILKQYDKNGNGRIDAEEREAPRREFHQERDKQKPTPPQSDPKEGPAGEKVKPPQDATGRESTPVAPARSGTVLPIRGEPQRQK